jgi:phosphoribosylanthranilate isomerase
MTAIKVCGLTRAEDVALAGALGARWLGFNFAAASPRRVGLRAAEDLARAAPASALRVGVFVAEPPSAIREAIDAARLDCVQIHRALTAADLDAARLPVVAVATVSASGPNAPAAELLARCAALLFDSGVGGVPGGTGTAFDWRLVAGRAFGVPVIVAGGLTPENVGRAVRAVRPAGVDVASGVEESPGVKDAGKLRRFFEAVARADGDGVAA